MLTHGTVADWITLGPVEHLFKGANELALYKYVYEHMRKFASLPQPDTVEKHTKLDLTSGPENWGYYLDIMRRRHVEKCLKDGMTESAAFLQTDNKDTDKALSTLVTTVMDLIRDNTASEIVDFRDAYDSVIGAYSAAYHAGSDYGFRFGWPTIDEMTGGLVNGDMAAIIGRPSKGKTWFSLYAAMNQWLETGKAFLTNPQGDFPCMHSRLFVSNEMKIEQIRQRLAAMVAKVPAMDLKHAELSTPLMKKLKTGLLEIKGFGAPLWLMDSNLGGTVENIWIRARQLKPDAIFIDGAYLLKHPTETDRYKRVAENAELIKSELAKLCPTICSYQFAKMKKKPKGDPITMDDIGYSDVIAQVCSLVLGLLEAETIETINTRKLSILKGRAGEQGSIEVNFNADKMEFGEVMPEAVGDLQFL